MLVVKLLTTLLIWSHCFLIAITSSHDSLKKYQCRSKHFYESQYHPTFQQGIDNKPWMALLQLKNDKGFLAVGHISFTFLSSPLS